MLTNIIASCIRFIVTIIHSEMATHQSIIKSVKPVILGILCGLVTASAVWDLLHPIIYNYSVNNSTVDI